MSKTPSQPQRFYGQNAVQAAAKYYGQKLIDPIAAHIIEDEGFVPGVYQDTKGIPTEGVGLTGGFIGKNFFTEVLPVFEKRARSIIPSYSSQPLPVQKAVMSAVYRGDLGPRTARLIEKKEYQKAAKEYLNHQEYRKLKRKNPDHGVVKRMERNAELIRQGGNP